MSGGAVRRLRAVDADQRWRTALEAVCADPEQPRLVRQPVVDLARGVVAGYEVLSRFDSPLVDAPPDVWFAQAQRLGLAAPLEARVVARAVALLREVPEPRFLAVNVSPLLLLDDLVVRAFGAGVLTGLVVELTEHVEYDATPAFLARLAALRDAGALIAVDDAGSGYAGLGQLLSVRPQLLKLDRGLVDHLDEDPGRRATVELLGTLAGHLDAWVLAEGVERVEELDACVAMGVPLAQGYLLGRPQDGWPELPSELAVRLRRTALRVARRDRVAALATGAGSVGTGVGAGAGTGAATGAATAPRVELDARGCPVVLHLPLRRGGDAPGALRATTAFLRVQADTSPADALQRALQRAEEQRWDPLVCIDDTGRHVGLVAMEALIRSILDERQTP